MENDDDSYTAPPLHSPNSSSSGNPFAFPFPSPSSYPPPFSSLYSSPAADEELSRIQTSVTESGSPCFPAFSPAQPFKEPSTLQSQSLAQSPVILDTKAALSRDKTGEASGKGPDDGEPPPPYTEGYSPLESFTYVMAAAGGAASIITQVQQTGGGPVNALGGTRTPHNYMQTYIALAFLKFANSFSISKILEAMSTSR